MNKLDNVKTGDILAWKRNRENTISNLLIRGICYLTAEEFGHVGIALRMFGNVYVFEASYPSVRITALNTKEEVFHIPMDIEPNQESMDFLHDILGLDYSIRDDVRALFGRTSLKDDEWQCAEVVLAFLDANGISLDVLDIPGRIVSELRMKHQKQLILLE